jgi:hypothetical protein
VSKPKRYHLEMQKADDGDWVLYSDYARLKAEVERMTKAGDAMAAVITQYRCSPWGQKVPTAFTVWQAWFDAKEGKGNE